jgi:hypothetical protein
MAKDEVNFAVDTTALEARIILALETAPQHEIPSDFAAKVARQLPPRPTFILTPGRYGPRAAMVCVVVLLALLLTFAHRATGASLLWISIESLFCAQFALLAVWLVARNVGSAFTSFF